MSEVSKRRVDEALDIITEEFNLEDKEYAVTKFDDKGIKGKITVENPMYEVTVLIKNFYPTTEE